MISSVIGFFMARRMRRSTFVTTTLVLTALSCVPSLALGTGIDNKLGLVLTHLIAAAIVIPAFSRREG